MMSKSCLAALLFTIIFILNNVIAQCPASQCGNCKFSYMDAPPSAESAGLVGAPGDLTVATDGAGCKTYTLTCRSDARGNGFLVGSAGQINCGGAIPILNGPPGLVTTFTCNARGQTETIDKDGNRQTGLTQSFCLQTIATGKK